MKGMSMSNLEKIDKRVARGARYLEKNYGTDWRQWVNYPIVMSGSGSCVLSQVSGRNYWTLASGRPNRWAVRRGFNAPHRETQDYDNTYYGYLDTAWQVEVGMRDFQPLKDEV
jgi:hypothetical protein